MKFYYVANARMPNEKAHGIQIAKMCEAFIEAGADFTLVVPRRAMTDSLKSFYNLRVEVPLVRLPAINLYNYERTGYFVSSLSFMLTSLLFLWWKKLSGEKFIVYTIDMDNYSSSALPLARAPLFSEMHGGKPDTFVQRFLFRHVRGIFAINNIIIDEFKNRFPCSRATYLSEPNGVDIKMFVARTKQEARTKLNLPHDKKIVLYTGRFFAWKGLEILPQAARQTSNTEWYVVGGTREDFIALVSDEIIPDTMHFMGGQEQAIIPWWLAAADVLVVLGTKRDQQSYFYTSPMKLFEYLLSKRVVVASDTPAIRQVVSEAEVFLYTPDQSEDLVRQIQVALSPVSTIREKITRAYDKGIAHAWSARAKRILTCIEQNITTTL